MCLCFCSGLPWVPPPGSSGSTRAKGEMGRAPPASQPLSASPRRKLPNILGKSCYGNLTFTGKNTSPPQTPAFCAPHCQPVCH